jgi:predicted esterase
MQLTYPASGDYNYHHKRLRMKQNIPIFLFLVLLFIDSSIAFSQAPTDNPYQSKYNSGEHWTDQIHWKDTTNALNVPDLIDKNMGVDSVVLHNTMRNISKRGGGILYFSSGEYFFNYSITIPENVVIRGANPVSIIDAKNNQYRPPTKFQFPKYLPSFHGEGTPDYTAFKRIRSEPNANFGLVNLDINRALLWVPGSNRSNIMFFGIRSNNAVEYRSIYLANSKDHKWQRYPNSTSGNFMITFYKGVIANCRINDSITDDFEMPEFMTNEGYVSRDKKIKFQYGLQGGIRATSYSDTCELELLDNYVKAHKVSEIESLFQGKKLIRNNQFEFLPCQDLITKHFYSVERENYTASVFGKERYFIKERDSLRYFILEPENYDPAKKYPVVFFLHGIGEHGEENPLNHFVHLFANDSIRKKYPYFVIVPHLKRNESFQAFLSKPPTKALQMSMDLMKNIRKKYSFDKRRTFIAGISTGADAACEVAVRYPKLFKNAIVMSALRQYTKEQFEKVKGINFILSFGTKDEHAPIGYVREGVNIFNKLGIKIAYFEYEEVGHWSWLNLTMDERFLGLMFK